MRCDGYIALDIAIQKMMEKNMANFGNQNNGNSESLGEAAAFTAGGAAAGAGVAATVGGMGLAVGGHSCCNNCSSCCSCWGQLLA